MATSTKKKTVKKPATKQYNVMVATWYESELGWGTRPDGYSYHLTEADYKAYFKKYTDSLPAEVPYIYSTTTGDLTVKTVSLTTKEHEVLKLKKGLRHY